ncbi:MAG: response regulator [Flammeovirgaceae bacterium]|nr:response regulator [Flammeovirgaceae bacterium]MDW8288398.1 response regulator [Flammeovirgaceae bacterium]
MTKKRVLIVDDSLYMRTVIKDALTSANYEIVGQAANGEQAIDMALSLKPDIITLDNILPDMLGLDILRTLKEEKLPSKIVMISAVGQQSVVDEGIRLGLDGYIVKPFTAEQLLETLQQVLKS